jgi:hypothetical protein
MAVTAISTQTPASIFPSGESPPFDREVVLEELERVLRSAPFRSSSRSREFLAHVVRHKLEGHAELLKERTIGNELFHRKADYSTGDDAIVRVHAGDVRKRLEQYYQPLGSQPQVRIELPVGSYIPEFHVRVSPPSADTRGPRPAGEKRRWLISAGIVLFIAALVGVGVRIKTRQDAAHPSAMAEFWAPALSTSQPVLICMSKPVLYRPSLELYRQYSNHHRGVFETEVERMNAPLPLDPNQRILWKDMLVYSEFGVAAGDAYAAFRISALLGRMDKATQFRIGSGSSFDDLRNSPAVIIGAFSNRWTLEVTSSLHYAFDEKDSQFWIEDRNSTAKRWFTQFNQRGEMVEDFGISNRLLNSKTGQLVITVAGIRAAGSDAAAQLVSNPAYLKEALRSAPSDWKNKNIQFVVKTEVVDSVAGPPQVVASYFW